MSDVRQLPLFPQQPASIGDLNRFSALRDTLALFQQHLLRAGKSEHTVRAFTSDLLLLAEFTNEKTPVGRYTTDLLNQFMDWLENGRGVPCSRKSYARRVTTLKVYFKWLTENHVLAHDPAKALLQRSGPAPLAVILSASEIERALAVARVMQRTLRGVSERDTRPEMLFRLILDTGIKKNETMELTARSINRLNPQLPFLDIKHSKARDIYKERKIFLDPAWLALFDQYMAQYQPRERLITCTSRNLEYILEDIGKGAEIETKISFEMLRWTCAVRDYVAGVEPDTIREKLGLSPISWYETFAKTKRLAELYIEES
ncbi:MAG: site-specific integrase [Chloroflexi bacterium]|nr:site-specific integrase [Chloroflexota bacterium]